jgi:Cof subfamily protein (haloacid dehalogenase superfamily)
MDAEMIQLFLNIAKDKDHEAVMYTNEKNVVTSNESQVMNDFIQHFHLKHNVLYQSEYIDQILGVSLLNLGKNDVALYEEGNNIHLSSINVAGFKDHSYDVIRDEVNKGFAVQKVVDLLGFKPEEAIAFGDGMNDKEMLSLVGTGFAMGNAHPDLFQYAKYKTTDVENSGVFNGLKSLELVD